MTEFWKGEKEFRDQNVEFLKKRLGQYVDPKDISMVRAIADQLNEEESKALIAKEELEKTPTQQ